jgi:hypothetical protein
LLDRNANTQTTNWNFLGSRRALVAGALAITALLSSCAAPESGDIHQPDALHQTMAPHESNPNQSLALPNSLTSPSETTLPTVVVPTKPEQTPTATTPKSSVDVKSHKESAESCLHVQGPFSVDGNERLDGQDKPFIPYGITLDELSQGNGEKYDIIPQIKALSAWCVNYVRIQTAPEDAYQNITPGEDVNMGYVRVIERAVQAAIKRKLFVVITSQDERTGGPANPTLQTLKYLVMLNNEFKDDKIDLNDVVVDPFNEPREVESTRKKTWELWHNGGFYKGVKYLGMQALVKALRKYGVQEQLWVEGPYAADTLQFISDFPINDADTVNALHHPAPDGPHTPAVWNKLFGDQTSNRPIVIDEFAQYASAGAICWENAPALLPNFLEYLKEHEVGLGLWTLKKGVLVSGSNYTTPTHFTTPTTPEYVCRGNADLGAGSEFMHYFKANNVASPNA